VPAALKGSVARAEAFIEAAMRGLVERLRSDAHGRGVKAQPKRLPTSIGEDFDVVAWEMAEGLRQRKSQFGQIRCGNCARSG
jgi:hypothetical protein